GRPDLYRRSSYRQVFKHVFGRLDASEPNNWCLDGLLRFPDEPQSNGFNGRAGKTPGLAAEEGLSGAEVDGHRRVGVCHGQGVSAGFLGRPGDKSNGCNERRKFDPNGAFCGGLSRGTDYLGDAGGIAPELHAPLLDVGAGDIEFVADQAFGVLQDPDYLDVVLEGVAEDVGDDCRIIFSQYREFFGYKGPDPHILESD